MKKFNTNELLSRDEMKNVAGAGYGGCNQGSCGFVYVDFRVEGAFCASTSSGCKCANGPYVGQSC